MRLGQLTLLVFAAEKGLAQYAAWAKMIRGWALASAGRFDQGLAETEEGLTTLRPTGVLYHIPHRLGMRAQTYALAGRPQQALDAIEEALASVEQTDERWYESELLRIKAEMLAKAPIENFRSAEACLEQAIATAAGRGALLWEARARIDLARLLASEQREAAACSVIAPLRAWHTDIDLPERARAVTLLERLGAGG